MNYNNRKFPQRKIHRPISAGELTDRYRPDFDALQLCAQQVEDHISERGGRQKGEMSGMELMQLKNMRSIFELVLPPEGSPIIVDSDSHIDDIQHRHSGDEVANPVPGLFHGEYLGIDINEYRFTNNQRYFGLVVGLCVELQNGARTFTTPVLGSTIYFYNSN